MIVTQLAQHEEIREWQRRIQDIMDEMRNRSFCDYRASGTWLPNVNIYECPSAYYVCVELAGLERSSVSIECSDAQHVSISGQRTRPRAPGLEDPFSVDLMEIDEGPFLRAIDFNEPVAAEAAELLHDDGYLWIILRKAPTT
jgi:HSP20 family protein